MRQVREFAQRFTASKTETEVKLSPSKTNVLNYHITICQSYKASSRVKTLIPISFPSIIIFLPLWLLCFSSRVPFLSIKPVAQEHSHMLLPRWLAWPRSWNNLTPHILLSDFLRWHDYPSCLRLPWTIVIFLLNYDLFFLWKVIMFSS